MTECYKIHGGKALHGRVRISGEKNSVLPMLACTLLTDEVCTLIDIPEISDIEHFVSAFRTMGSIVEWDKQSKTLTICHKDITIDSVKNAKELSFTRANVVLIGALTARFGGVTMPLPGGDRIGVRPLDELLKGLENYGVEVSIDDGYITTKQLSNTHTNKTMILAEASVTGTETLALYLAGVEDTGEIFFAAADPQVQATLTMLQKMGAEVSGIGTHTVRITGKKRLQGVEIRVPFDVTVAGTYAIAAIITNGDVVLENIHHPHLYSFYGYLKRLGVNFSIENDMLHIHPQHNLKAIRKIHTNIYPGLCPDIQSPMGVLLTQCDGTTMLFDWMYENRFGYLYELQKMGAQVELRNPHQAYITGKTKLKGTRVQSYDLRAGASMVLAGLIAEGTTLVTDIEWIARGYEHFANNLRALGADITTYKEVGYE